MSRDFDLATHLRPVHDVLGSQQGLRSLAVLFRSGNTMTRQAINLRLNVGFTLVELMVVVAIISILLALLAPPLSRAKEQTRRTTCVNNQTQMAQRVFDVASMEMRGVFPSAAADNGANHHLTQPGDESFKAMFGRFTRTSPTSPAKYSDIPNAKPIYYCPNLPRQYEPTYHFNAGGVGVRWVNWDAPIYLGGHDTTNWVGEGLNIDSPNRLADDGTQMLFACRATRHGSPYFLTVFAHSANGSARLKNTYSMSANEIRIEGNSVARVDGSAAFEIDLVGRQYAVAACWLPDLSAQGVVCQSGVIQTHMLPVAVLGLGQ
jgi:prepilin-type N-terminal cleavage/methylation domain-containing protein